MSLIYNSLRNYVKPDTELSDVNRERIMEYMRQVDILSRDSHQTGIYNYYDLLMSKIRRVEISLMRSDSLGLNIRVEYTIVPNMSVILQYHTKKSNEISLVIVNNDLDEHESNYIFYNDNVSGLSQKLWLDKLPQEIRNVMMYYIYPPTIYDRTDMESVNRLDNWKLNNKWNIVSNFIFALIETIYHKKYTGLPYEITLRVNACKDRCDPGDEAIIIKKRFK